MDSTQNKLPASRFSLLYWKIRGYSDEESKQKVFEAQSKNGSFKEKRRKLAQKGFSETEIEQAIQEAAIKRGKINSNSHRKAQEKDPTYLRSMSHHCPEFWIKKSFSEEEAKIKAAEVCEKNRNKFREKLDSGEIEKGWNNTTVEYYLKKGMTVNEARQAVIDRQKTFTLAKCIAKYGETLGTEKWKARQEKWKNSIYSGESCIAVGTSKIFKEFAENFDATREFYLRTSEYCFIYDLKKGKKIIEFNGDYWHCNPKTYSPDFFHTIKQMTAKEIWDYDKKKEDHAKAKGYDYLTIWESEYKLFPEETINKCKEFLNK